MRGFLLVRSASLGLRGRQRFAGRDESPVAHADVDTRVRREAGAPQPVSAQADVRHIPVAGVVAAAQCRICVVSTVMRLSAVVGLCLAVAIVHSGVVGCGEQPWRVRCMPGLHCEAGLSAASCGGPLAASLVGKAFHLTLLDQAIEHDHGGLLFEIGQLVDLLHEFVRLVIANGGFAEGVGETDQLVKTDLKDIGEFDQLAAARRIGAAPRVLGSSPLRHRKLWHSPFMQGIPATFDFPTDSAEFRHPAHRAGVELYRAHIVRHAFEPHTHAAFGLGAIEQGVERFRLRGAEHLAPADSLVLMNPDELHTGRAETEGGWRYRMIYLDADVAAAISGEADWWFADAVRVDVPRARQVTALLDRLWRTPSPLAFDGLLAELLQTLSPHVQRPRRLPAEGAFRFERVVDYMHAHLADRITLEQLAAVAHLSPFHFLRRFRAQYYATPQQLLMALRLQRAKRLLAAGFAPAQVAAECGLADQAHLTRAFAWRYGVTPARYQRQLLGRVWPSAGTGG